MDIIRIRRQAARVLISLTFLLSVASFVWAIGYRGPLGTLAIAASTSLIVLAGGTGFWNSVKSRMVDGRVWACLWLATVAIELALGTVAAMWGPALPYVSPFMGAFASMFPAAWIGENMKQGAE